MVDRIYSTPAEQVQKLLNEMDAAHESVNINAEVERVKLDQFDGPEWIRLLAVQAYKANLTAKHNKVRDSFIRKIGTSVADGRF